MPPRGLLPVSRWWLGLTSVLRWQLSRRAEAVSQTGRVQITFALQPRLTGSLHNFNRSSLHFFYPKDQQLIYSKSEKCFICCEQVLRFIIFFLNICFNAEWVFLFSPIENFCCCCQCRRVCVCWRVCACV